MLIQKEENREKTEKTEKEGWSIPGLERFSKQGLVQWEFFLMKLDLIPLF